jgi:hypothetical protein
MLCAERLQRVVMAIMITLSMYLLTIGSIFGIILQGFIIGMILLWAITNFCPSIWMFEKLFGKCDWNK